MGKEQPAIAERSNQVFMNGRIRPRRIISEAEDVSPPADALIAAVEAAYNAPADAEEKETDAGEIGCHTAALPSAGEIVNVASTEIPTKENETPVQTGRNSVSSSPDRQREQLNRASPLQTLYEDIWAELCTRHPSTWADGEAPPGFLILLSASIAATAEPTIWDFVKFPRSAEGMEIGEDEAPLQQEVLHIPDHLLEQVGEMVLRARDEHRIRHNVPAFESWPPTTSQLEAGALERQQFWLRIFDGRTLPESLQPLCDVRFHAPSYATYAQIYHPPLRGTWNNPTIPQSTFAAPQPAPAPYAQVYYAPPYPAWDPRLPQYAFAPPTSAPAPYAQVYHPPPYPAWDHTFPQYTFAPSTLARFPYAQVHNPPSYTPWNAPFPRYNFAPPMPMPAPAPLPHPPPSSPPPLPPAAGPEPVEKEAEEEAIEDEEKEDEEKEGEGDEENQEESEEAALLARFRGEPEHKQLEKIRAELLKDQIRGIR